MLKSSLAFACLFACLLSAATAWPNSAKIALTPPEQAWLADHPEIRLGFNPHMEPLLIRGEDGSYAGIYPTIIGELEEILGVSIDIEVADWDPIVQKARNREIDGLLACAPSQAEASGLARTQPIHQSYPVAFTRQDAPFTINRLEDLQGKSIAYQGEVKMLEVALAQLGDDTRIIAVGSTLEALRLVLEGKVDVAFGVNFENYLVAKHALTGIRLTYFDLTDASPISTCIRDDWPELVDIFNKGLDHLGKARIQQILLEWTNAKKHLPELALTNAELVWLAAHPVIRVGADPAWAPIEFRNKEGVYSGLAIDYLKILEPMLGVRFEFVPESWQELIARAKQGRLDMFSCVARTSERDKYLLFTEPYVEMPAGIFTRDDAGYIANLKVIADERIAVVAGYAIHDFMVANYPDINLVLVRTAEEGINKLIRKEAYAFIDSSITTGYLISHQGYVQIKMSGEAPFINAQRMGIRQDWPQLRAIIQKALATIPEADRHALYRKWAPATYEQPADYSLIWKIGAGCFLLVVLFFFWNRKLTSEVRKRTKDFLRSERRYRRLTENAKDMIYRMTLPEGKYEYVSPAAEEIFGYTPDEFYNSPQLVKDLIHPNWHDYFAEQWQRLLAGDMPPTYEYQIIRKSGETRWLNQRNVLVRDEAGQPEAIEGIVTDITENKRTAQEILDNFELFKAVFEQTRGYAMILQPQPGGIPTILDANKAACEAHGWQREEMIGRPVTDLEDQEGKRLCSERTKHILAGNTLSIETNHVRKDGSTFPVAVFANIVRFESKPPVILTFEYDISDARQAEQERRQTEIQLRQAQKMEAIGTLAGGIAHDFNNILSVILGYADLAKEDAPPGTLFANDLDQVLIAANRAKDLVKQILAFSRQSQVERLPITIQPLIKEGLKMLRASIPTTISITEDIDPASGTILADPTQINQILMNLCTNAYHAMEETGGELSVSLRATYLGPDQPDLHIPVKPGEYLELKVADTGKGIGPDIIGNIFDPYYTTKAPGKGTGLGLAIIHGIISDYGGSLAVESNLGGGSTFRVYFPLLEKAAVPAIKESEDIPRGKERILFIDDEELLAEMGKVMLERLGYRVTVRRNSLEALTTFQNTPEAFDLVITDQTMPHMTGTDLARRMLQIRPDMPIILCTGYSNLVDEHSAKHLGIKEFALKPLTRGSIAKLIRKALQGAA